MINIAEIEHTFCPLCNRGRNRIVYDNFNPYNVVRCVECGLYYLSPRLKESVILKLYQDSAYYKDEAVGYSNYGEQERALRATFRRLMINLRKRNLTGGALLEVGCGYLLEEARGFFHPRIGTELSRHAVEQALGRADHIYEGGIDQIPAHERFDCIIATQVIEHVYQPKAFLERLYKHLRPKGKMIIATPNMGSLWRKLMGHHWPSFKIPEHVLFFDRKSLSNLLQHTGLKDIASLPYPHAFPLSLIASKLHIPLPLAMGKYSLWLPATTIAICGVAPDE